MDNFKKEEKKKIFFFNIDLNIITFYIYFITLYILYNKYLL